MDIFVEQIVKKVPGGKEIMLKMLILTSAIILGILSFVFFWAIGFFPMGLLFAGCLIYFGVYLSNNFNVEYEYILTNGELDIDKITAKRKRKRLLTANVSKFTKFGQLGNASEVGEDVTTILTTAGLTNDDYYADFEHSSYGKVRLIFSPNENFVEKMKPYIPARAK